ncbi:selenium cofactor biosynthesis protein YqeC [Irregularibacter muris]|jgi:probable selenium-dependent hydroxylase accessory protein YqeC|uniref:Selenium cofactor biosynthesis protein YqeC n=1 Tax=Irregularibacter muris TaxID=1796619 RepID=A0AAE3L419_9FIRM|nr:selenium cofactor biosynthesis protein YqeC [Irregularibacter muris]MCR1899283.1 selenium cofactor biosynthesis protein YqeC [Irregularibacter muris]
MLIYDSLEINGFPSIISLVGGGGKSTTMYRFAQELSQKGKKVLVTTTTHLALPKDNEVEKLVIQPDYLKAIEELHSCFEKHFIVGLATTKVREDKIKGISVDWVGKIKEENIADVILVEADGANRKPFKAHASHEPALPEKSDVVIIVVGIDALGKPITEQYVHRPKNILNILHLGEEEQDTILTKEMMAEVILHKKGLLKKVEQESKVFVLINKIDEKSIGQAEELAQIILSRDHPKNFKILLGQVQNPLNPILQRVEEKEKW